MNREQRTRASKFLAYVLRHEPLSIGLQLDTEGWAEIDRLIAGAVNTGQSLDRSDLRGIVTESAKMRFEISDDGNRIRAIQGHSTSQVNRTHIEKTPPDTLYHGTAKRCLDAILKDGLFAGSRHHVHLAGDVQSALANGRRYGEAVVLRIESLRMHHDRLRFFQAENGVWLVDCVPARYLKLN
ncbi:RNA 2'-phosphotransferase [Cupriavidus sp. NPDC089707]|uniref:RNA 2'-phosphotransferase n=1 Tax=Cupriavidus sp. NPDC089707 TaxID=3363963 RepID=UPI00381F8DD6